MNPKKLVALLAIAVLLIPSVAQPKEKKQPISDTRTASCLVKVTADPAVLPLSFEAIDYLLHSSSVAGKTARTVLGLSPDKSPGLFYIERLPSGPRVTGKAPRDEEVISLLRMMEEQAEKVREETPASMGRFGGGMRGSGGGMGGSGGGMGGSRGGLGGGRGARRVPRVRPAAAAPPAYASEQSILFRLQVELPDDVKPAAEEFMVVLIDNLRRTLSKAFDDNRRRLETELALASQNRKDTQFDLSVAMGIAETAADVETKKQLDEIVNLSEFRPEMSFGDAIEILKVSVEPPLKIIVLWRDLYENADIEQTTPINMDPISGVPLGMALERLLNSVSGVFTELAYEIEDGIITIATADSLPRLQEELLQSAQLDIPVELTLAQKQNLLRERQNFDMEIARLQALRPAIEEQIRRIRKEIEERVHTDAISDELKNILALQVQHLEKTKQLVEQGRTTSAELAGAEEKIARARIELAKRREQLSKSAGGDQLANFNNQIAMLMVGLAEQKAMLDVVSKQLEQTERQLTTTASLDPQISQIRLAAQGLKLAERRINELKSRLANLQPPTVTVIGAD